MSINPLDYKISELNNLKPEKGTILIAEPFMKDPYFQRSIVLMAENSKETTLGFILNKSLDIPINEAIEDFPEFNAELFLGGPVQSQNLFYIHTKGNLLEGSEQINEKLHWGGDFDVLKKLIKKGGILPNEIKFFLGYSGWEKGQLDLELKEGSWLVGIQESESILSDKGSSWKEAMSALGKKQAIMANFPTDPSFN